MSIRNVTLSFGKDTLVATLRTEASTDGDVVEASLTLAINGEVIQLGLDGYAAVKDIESVTDLLSAGTAIGTHVRLHR
jgi:hypothetical protein